MSYCWGFAECGLMGKKNGGMDIYNSVGNQRLLSFNVILSINVSN